MRKACCGSTPPFASHCRTADKGKFRGDRSPFPHHACACAFLEALGQVLCHCSALGARTGRALQDCLHAERELSICFTFGEGPSEGAPRQWHSIRFALGSCARSFAVRALCAHQRQGNASHKAKRFQKRAGHGRGSRKAQRFAYAFPTPKAGKCFAQGKALPKACRPQARVEKGLRSSLPLSPTT